MIVTSNDCWGSLNLFLHLAYIDLNYNNFHAKGGNDFSNCSLIVVIILVVVLVGVDVVIMGKIQELAL